MLNTGARFWHLIRGEGTDFTAVCWSITVRSAPSQKAGLWRAGRACPVSLQGGSSPLTLLQLVVHSSFLCPLLCNPVSGTWVLVQSHFLPRSVISSLLVITYCFWRSHSALH